METVEATNGARLKSLDYISQADDTFFQILKVKNDIIFGDLLLSRNGKRISLTNELMNCKILAKNEHLFWECKYLIVINLKLF